MEENDESMPERLWHYTSGGVAKSIFENRMLWAGHLGFMNDTSEVNHAMNLSVEVVELLRPNFPHYGDAFDQWKSYVTDSPPKSWAPNTFAVSFSEEPDLLSQWRGYATGSGGPFSLGFPSAMLTDRLGEVGGQMWTLRRCIYDHEGQLEHIKDHMVAALRMRDAGRMQGFSALRAIKWWVMNAAPLCKHPAFDEEREWRLVVGPIEMQRAEAVHFVERRHTLAPYIEFPLADGDNPLDDIHWVAGPGPQQERAHNALGMVAHLAGMTGCYGVKSETPFLP